MDIEKLLTALRHEHARVHAAITAIERLTKVQIDWIAEEEARASSGQQEQA